MTFEGRGTVFTFWSAAPGIEEIELRLAALAGLLALLVDELSGVGAMALLAPEEELETLGLCGPGRLSLVSGVWGSVASTKCGQRC